MWRCSIRKLEKKEGGWRKYEEIQWRWRQLLHNVQIKTVFGQIGKLYNEIDVGSIEGNN